MGRLFFLGCLVLGLTGAGAAQEQSAPATDWSGFYVGADLGVGLASLDAVTTVANEGTYFSGDDNTLLTNAGSGELSQWRPVGGARAGYLHQMGGAVLGLEASAGTLFFDKSRSAQWEYNTAPGVFGTIEQSVRADWVATLQARAGWGEDRWLAYVTTGMAVTRLEIDYRYSDDSGSSARSRSSEREVRFGWTLGLGGEYALDENWSIRGQYLYANFGTLKTYSPVQNSGGFTGDLAHEASLETHTALIGVSYRF
jgi:opacity protein-like surface antigen